MYKACLFTKVKQSSQTNRICQHIPQSLQTKPAKFNWDINNITCELKQLALLMEVISGICSANTTIAATFYFASTIRSSVLSISQVLSIPQEFQHAQ
ncbi:hypothetical protein [Providencia rettgeri]|uniref:hypothetical protein n=1 Tax=Providencia rettgeri TaxID=587 RepID=UPI0034E0A3BE